MSSTIPIVDLGEFNLAKDQEDVSEDVQRQLAAQIIDAFSTAGFVRLKNFGIPQAKVQWDTTRFLTHNLTMAAHTLEAVLFIAWILLVKRTRELVFNIIIH